MGAGLMRLLLLAGAGWPLYYLLRALDRHEMAGLLKVLCFALGVTIAMQLIAEVCAWVGNLPLVRFFVR